MRWLADECVHSHVVQELRKAGHDVAYVVETEQRSRDVALLDRALEQQRILLTEDKDFGDLVFRQDRPSGGVILFRMDSWQWKRKWQLLREAINEYGEALYARYTVVEEARTRSLPLPPK